MQPLVQPLAKPLAQKMSNITGKSLVVGPELLTNGSFTGNATGWTLTGGWLYLANSIVCPNTGTASQAIALVQGKTYRVTYDVIINSGDGITAQFVGAGVTSGTKRSVTGTYSEDITVTTASPTTFRLNITTATNGGVDNVSVKELT